MVESCIVALNLSIEGLGLIVEFTSLALRHGENGENCGFAQTLLYEVRLHIRRQRKDGLFFEVRGLI